MSSCLPGVSHIFLASVLAIMTSCTFHHHVSLSTGCILPVVIPSTSRPTLNIVVLVSPHHPSTLSTGYTFSNTVSLHFILRFSYFNIHDFIFGVAGSGFQPFLPSVRLLMFQFRYPPTITLSPSGVAFSS